MPSNQGQDIDQLLDDVDLTDLSDASAYGWTEFRRHPLAASCECPAVEILGRLYALGYRMTKPKLDRAQRTAGQIAHITEHAASFADLQGGGQDIAEYIHDHGDTWDIYQRLCDDMQIEPKPEFCHPNPED